MYIDYVIEENYHRIKDDISMILQSHGIGLESEAAEVTTDAGQPQVHEEDEEQCTGPADGIVEEIVPNITCQWMTNLTNRISCHLMTGFSITKVTV